MRSRVSRGALAGLLFGAAAESAFAQAAPKILKTAPQEQQKLVVEAGETWDRFQSDPDMTWFRQHDKDAVGFLISPKVVKAGFIFGGSGGRAVLVAKSEKGWSGPVFYSVGTASVGFQAGVDVSEIVTLVMNKKALEGLLSGSLKFGANASVSAGPVGTGAGTSPNTDFLAYSRSKGLYGGVNLNGAVVNSSEDDNRAYYGEIVTPIDVIVRGSFRNLEADKALLGKVAKAVASK